MQLTRWGILAPGSIAHKFARGLQGAKGAKLVAVGSRSLERARAFAGEFGAERAYGSYQELVEDDQVDAIYVSNPHPYHKDSAILCLEHGKAVLCEKPFTVNAREAEAVVAVARRTGVFLMEAMWTRFLPHMQQARAWIDAGKIGEIKFIDATFSFGIGWNPEGRLLNPDLAGGGILDVGIYVASFAYWMTGRAPDQVVSAAHIGDTGVDELAAFIFSYSTGALATLKCGVRAPTSHTAVVYGSEGSIEFPAPFWNGTSATLHSGKKSVKFRKPHHANGYEFEAMEVGRCLEAGKTESDILPLDETVTIMRTLDTIRDQIGLVYPFEK